MAPIKKYTREEGEDVEDEDDDEPLPTNGGDIS